MLAIAIPAGLLIGLSLGALGGGGSILTVPVLVYLLHQPPHAATAGSLLIVGITATAGMVAHQRVGRVRLAPGVTSVSSAARRLPGHRLSSSIRPDLLLTCSPRSCWWLPRLWRAARAGRQASTCPPRRARQSAQGGRAG